MNKTVLGIGLLLVLPLVYVLGRGFGSDPQFIPCPLIGQPAPAFTLPVLDGNGKTLALDSLQGKPVVLNFWATWCDTCGYEHPAISRLALAYTGRVEFIGVAYLDSEDNLRKWLKSHGGSHFPTLIDVGTGAAVAFGVGRLPETYLIDSKGVVRNKVFGAIEPEQFVQDIEALL